MSKQLEQLQQLLCKSMCATIELTKKTPKLIRIDTPFYFSDGDPYQIYLEEMAHGTFRITDKGHTWMQLSYESDIDTFKDGTRGQLLDTIKTEFSLQESEGAFFIEASFDTIGNQVLRFGQALTRITDLYYLNRPRVEKTFYEDLATQLRDILPENVSLNQDYINDTIDSPEIYPIDFMVPTHDAPLYIFGIGSKNKALRTNVILEHLLREQVVFDSLLVFNEMDKIPRQDIARLMNVGNEMISSLKAQDDMKRKLIRKIQ